MKKYIMLFLVLFLYFDKVKASEICEEIKTDIGYNSIMNDSKYTYDENDYIINYGEWKDYSGEDIDNIEIKPFYKYNKINPVRYLHIYNTKDDLRGMDITELKILNNGEEIVYEKECVECSNDTLDYLNDDNYDSDKRFTFRFWFGHLIIDLLDEYELEDLNIQLYLHSNGLSLLQFYIGFSNNKNLEELITSKFLYEEFKTEEECKMFEYSVTDKWNFNSNYVTLFETDQLIENNPFYIKIDEYKKFRNIDIKYRTYLIEKKCKEVLNEVEEVDKQEPVCNINPIVETVNSINDNIQYEKEISHNLNFKVESNKVSFVGSNFYKEITNTKEKESACQNIFYLIIYLLIMLNSLVILFLLKLLLLLC